MFGVGKIEYRKLISFGKSSYVVSLPKAWVRKNKLEKGALIYFDEKDPDLILSITGNQVANNREVTINIDGKEMRQIKREIIGGYIKNNKTIILAGNDIKDKAKEIQPIIQSLVALEVMEQTTKKIVAKDFLNMDDVSTKTITRKIDVIIRSMFEDCKNMFIEDTYESINYRDNDVNKLVFLMFRIVRYGFENASYMIKKFGLMAIDLSNLWWLAFELESVADEVKRTARFMGEIKLNKKKQEEYVEILNKIERIYLDIMKAYHTHDLPLVHSVLNSRDEAMMLCDKFYLENKPIEKIAFLIDRTKAVVDHVGNVGRVIYLGF
ncbi:hypothetical protein HOC13_03865 [Candidatus Woesearchaeota archaeon]|nr:hypothetical protein [Candidatus Woesearchaeota archaeon]